MMKPEMTAQETADKLAIMLRLRTKIVIFYMDTPEKPEGYEDLLQVFDACIMQLTVKH